MHIILGIQKKILGDL